MLCLFSLKSCLDLSLLLIKIVRFGVGVCLVWVVVYLGVSFQMMRKQIIENDCFSDTFENFVTII